MVKIVCIGQQGLDPQHKLNVFVVKVWIKSSFPHIVGNVSVGPLARRGLSSWILDIYYLFEVRYIEYRYGLLYTVIITENYNQFYHRPTLTQRSARRIDSHLGDAIQIISPSNQKSQHCRNKFWGKMLTTLSWPSVCLVQCDLWWPLFFSEMGWHQSSY